MSANDAPGELNKDYIFGSPNITSAEDEKVETPEDKAAEEQRKRETVEIDGIPIDEKDIKFKAEDIGKKKKTNFFVNVEGTEELAKNEAKIAVDTKAEQRVGTNKADAAKLANVSEEGKRYTESVNAYAKQQNAQAAPQSKKIDRGSIDIKKLLFEGWHVYAFIGVVAVIVIIILCAIIIPIVQNMSQ